MNDQQQIDLDLVIKLVGRLTLEKEIIQDKLLQLERAVNEGRDQAGKDK